MLELELHQARLASEQPSLLQIENRYPTMMPIAIDNADDLGK